MANSIGDFRTGASAEVIKSAEKRTFLSCLQLLVVMLIKLHKHYVLLYYYSIKKALHSSSTPNCRDILI